MQLTVNGKAHTHAGNGSVQALLAELGADPARVALMVNDCVVRRDKRDEVALREGDRVEVLTFACGG